MVYVDNDTGLLMCGVCRKPKQMRIEILGELRTVPVLCDCEEEQRKREMEEAKERQRQIRIQRAKERCFGRGDRKAGFTFDLDDNRDAKTSGMMRGYVEHFAEMSERGKGLLLFGPTGTGKTFYACAIANALIEQGYSAIVTTFAEISADLQGTWAKNEVYNELNSVDLLVLDDLAAERNTEYMQEIVFTVIDARCAANKPMIVTSNLTADEFKKPTTQERGRIFSRLQEACLPVAVMGRDRRSEKMVREANSDYALLVR